ncbi:hypothetical protein GEMRC1_001721 [Eukaryota sp. GEM-RC1]
MNLEKILSYITNNKADTFRIVELLNSLLDHIQLPLSSRYLSNIINSIHPLLSHTNVSLRFASEKALLSFIHFFLLHNYDQTQLSELLTIISSLLPSDSCNLTVLSAYSLTLSFSSISVRVSQAAFFFPLLGGLSKQLGGAPGFFGVILYLFSLFQPYLCDYLDQISGFIRKFGRNTSIFLWFLHNSPFVYHNLLLEILFSDFNSTEDQNIVHCFNQNFDHFFKKLSSNPEFLSFFHQFTQLTSEFSFFGQVPSDELSRFLEEMLQTFKNSTDSSDIFVKLILIESFSILFHFGLVFLMKVISIRFSKNRVIL